MIHVRTRRAAVGTCSPCAARRQLGDTHGSSRFNPIVFMGAMLGIGVLGVLVLEWRQGGVRRRR